MCSITGMLFLLPNFVEICENTHKQTGKHNLYQNLTDKENIV